MRSSIRLGFLAAAFGVACTATQAASVAGGGMYVTTLPAAADVWIDGTYVGRSPVLADALAPGRHGVTITRTGWQAQRLPIQISGGGITMMSLRLLPTTQPGAEGTFVLRGVKATRVLLDGKRLFADATAPITAGPGAHELEVSTPRGKITRPFAVVPHTETEVVIRDAPQTHSARAAVDAPAAEYLPDEAVRIVDRRIVVRYAGHEVIGRLGDPVVRYDGAPTTYESAPTQIAGRLYLPLDLLQKLAAAAASSPVTRATPTTLPEN